MKIRIFMIIALSLAMIATAYSAPGDVVTIGPPRAFGNISTAGTGKIIATSNRDTLNIVGSGGLVVSTIPNTKTLTFSGSAFANSSSAVRKSGDTMTGQLSGTVFDASTGYRVGGAAASANYLRGNGTNFVSSAIQAADVPTLNQSTTGNAATVTTNANLTGPITSVGNATSIASQTGTGTKFVVDTSPTIITPTITTSATTPLIIGGTAAGSKVTYKSTTGVGTPTGIAHQFLGGTDGATVLTTILNNGNQGWGTAAPTGKADIQGLAIHDLPTYSAEFLSSSGWTSTDWTGDFATGWTHTTGNTTVLSQSTAAVNATKYQIAYTVTGRTAGSFTIGFGGATLSAITATGAWGPTTSSTASLTITPTTDFNGTIVISIKSITGISTPLVNLKSSDGTARIEMRANTAAGNTFIGVGAGRYNTTGNYNTANGNASLYANTTGNSNTANGYASLYTNTTGNSNTANGYASLYANTTGNSNTANGINSGRYIADGTTGRTTGNNGIYFGYNSKASADGTDNEIVIGYNAIGAGSNSVVLGNTSVTKTLLNGNVGIGTTSPTAKLQVNGNLATTMQSITLAAAATAIAVTSNVAKVTGDAGGNTIATITGGVSGQVLTLIFVDALVTITDTAATTANTVNLSAAFTSSADDVITLTYDGNKWFECSRSTN